MLRTPRSKAMFRAGLIAFLISALLQIPGRLRPEFHPDLLDGIRGVCLGIFIGTMAVTIWRNGRPATG
jgi:uncharacterized membrane protein YhhN